MKDQINTIREALEAIDNGCQANNLEHTLAALTQLEAMVGEQESSLAFYKRRCDALQQWQSKMRDPERTVVCDILANGHTLEPAGDRYAAPVAQQPQAEAVRVECHEVIAGVTGNTVRPRELTEREHNVLMRAMVCSGKKVEAPQQAEAVPSDVARDAAPIPDHELVTMYDERPTSDLEMIEFAREVERRHGIGVQPQHITDGSPCWCNPDVAYTDPETGASVIVHRRPQ